MTMLARKLALLLAPFALALAAVLAYSSWSPRVRQGVYDPELERKLRAWTDERTAIIVAGDSRAERQVVPEIIERRTGLATANVATQAGDLATLSRAMGHYPILGRARALILSTSIFQANDSSGYLSPACLLDMTPLEKLVLYRNDPWQLLLSLRNLPPALLQGDDTASSAGSTGGSSGRGFNAMKGNLRLPIRMSLDPQTIRHPWYWHPQLRGARWRVFRAALGRIAQASSGRVVLYQPPASPAWRAYTAGSFVDRAEREFSSMLAEASQRHPNVRFLDFYSQPDPRLADDLFYDIQHLNADGAALFTEILLDRIRDDLKEPVPRT